MTATHTSAEGLGRTHGVTPARNLAATVLLEIDARGLHAQNAIEAVLAVEAIDAAERALLHELVYGVLRHRLYLDWTLQQVAKETPYTRHPVLRQVLRLGAYQLFFLDRVPDYAAVDQSVELVKGRVGEGSVSLANALLRGLAKQRTSLEVPDLLDQPLEHIAVRYSHPRWLVKRWLKRFGAQRTIALCRSNNERPPLTLRVNRLRLDPSEYRRHMEAKGIACSAGVYAPDALRVIDGGAVAALPGYGLGWFYVQDEAAQLVPLLLAPRRGDVVLDACAAPGGKTTQIAEMMGNTGEIVAADRSPDRLLVVEENCRRLGVTCVQPEVADTTQALTRFGAARFDRILVDAPCAGLGVLRRHPEGKWSKDEGSIRTTSGTARTILGRVAELLKPRGVLVYSTCSTEPEENQDVVKEFLARHRRFRIEDPRPLLPQAARPLVDDQGYFSTVLNTTDLDGFFAVRLVRTG